jgi:hypothetical protein
MPSKTSSRPVSTKTIFVASEDRRRDFEDNVMTKFYLRNVLDAERVTKGDPARFIGILDVSRISGKSRAPRNHTQRHAGPNATGTKTGLRQLTSRRPKW